MRRRMETQVRLLIALFALLCMSPWASDAPDCNHRTPACEDPDAVCTFLEIPPGSGIGEWACVASLGEPNDPRNPHGPRKQKK